MISTILSLIAICVFGAIAIEAEHRLQVKRLMAKRVDALMETMSVK